MPISAWAGSSTDGLIYLFLPFYFAFAFCLMGLANYLITRVFGAKKYKFMGIEQPKTIKQRLFWIGKMAILIWITMGLLKIIL
jgi:hypothetical protein